MPSDIEQLASLCAKARSTLARAGRTLHDDIGPQLAAAGMLLSLVKTDFPKAAPAVQEVLGAIDKGMESVRALSQELNASPVDRIGLHRALLRFAEQDPRVKIQYLTTAALSRETASSIYEAASAAIQAASDAGAKTIRVAVTGSSGVRVRVSDDGRKAGRTKALAVPLRLAAASGLTVTLTTIKSTIVLISHAVRRPAGRRP